MKKLIIITSNKGGIGKSAYAKLVLHTAISRGFPVVGADMDAANPDIYRHLVFLGKKAIDIKDFVGDFGETSAYDQESMDGFLQAIDSQLREGPDNLVLVLNTASNGLDSLKPLRDAIFPVNGQYYDQETEVFGVYLFTPTDGGDYKTAIELMGNLGKAHTITVLPEHANTARRDYNTPSAMLGIDTQVTEVMSMKKLRTHAFTNQVAPETASFGLEQVGTRDLSWQIAYAWWSQHVADIVNLFGFTEPVSNSARKQATVTEDA